MKARRRSFSFRSHVCRPLVLLAALTASACAMGGDVTVIKLGHGLDVTHSVHRAMAFMADRVAEKSDGAIRIDLYPNEQLGTERQCVELLQIGSLGMTKISAAVLENFAPTYRVYSLPFLFRDEAHRFAVWDGPVGRALLQSLEPQRIRGLAYYDSGTRSFYSRRKPILHPDDLRGLKIRTQESATAMRTVQAMGGSATPIAWGELYTALQQGVVDGAENNPPSLYLSRHYEVSRYYSINEHQAVPDVLLVSTDLWESLSPTEQRWVQAAADESAELQRRLWQESTEDALAAMLEAGVEVHYPDKAPFIERVQPLYEQYERDPVIRDLVQRIEAVP